MSSTFGYVLKKMRVDRRLTLREFCIKLEWDPGNYSKLERGLSSPPHNPEHVMEIIRALELDIVEARQLYYAALYHHVDRILEHWGSYEPSEKLIG